MTDKELSTRSDSAGPERFWDFSVRTYRQTGVAEACLALQNRYGLDVNVLLFCCWFGATRGTLDESTIRSVLEFSEPWADQVVRPLRFARTWMKTTGCAHPGVSRDDCMRLREQIKNVEFEAEYLQQRTLEALTGNEINIPAREHKAGRSAMEANVRGYLDRCGVTPDAESLDRLAVILDAAMGSRSRSVDSAISDSVNGR